MENLSKENFWNAIMEKYPEAGKLFCNWIDKYKVEVGWDKLFGNDIDAVHYRSVQIKFHDIPFEMQHGIIARFDIECFNGVFTGKGKTVYENSRATYVSQFEDLFKDLNERLKTQSQ